MPPAKPESLKDKFNKAAAFIGGLIVKYNFIGKLAGRFIEQLRLEPEQRREVYFEVDSNSIGTKEYYGLVILSCFIATLGLLNNSAAVIIGAMIIAPLMNPTMGVAMGVVRGDIILVTRALKTLFGGVILGVFVALITATVFPIVDVYRINEIIARTEPNLLDLGIGLAAGAAGAFAITRKKISSSLPGVAIAVSLMPPLAVTGIGIHLLEWKIAGGSFLLCLANLVCINLAGIGIFLLAGFGAQRDDESLKEFRSHFIISVALMLVMIIPLSQIYLKVLKKETIRKKANSAVTRFINEDLNGAYTTTEPEISERMIKILGDNGNMDEVETVLINTTIYSPSYPSAAFAFRLRSFMEMEIGKPVDLTIRFVSTSEYENRSYIIYKDYLLEKKQEITK